MKPQRNVARSNVTAARVPHSQRAVRRRYAPLVWIVSAAACAAVSSGCQPGVNWEFGTFREVQTRAARAKMYTFVYFRSWASKDCTAFESNVLEQPEIRALTARFVCVPLDESFDRDLMAIWGLREVPAYAIVAPDGALVRAAQAPLTLGQLRADLEAVAGAGAATTP